MFPSLYVLSAAFAIYKGNSSFYYALLHLAVDFREQFVEPLRALAPMGSPINTHLYVEVSYIRSNEQSD